MSNHIEIAIELQLGDIIRIMNPTNENLNKQIFLIDYIDDTKIVLINVTSLKKHVLSISENGILGDGTITEIDLLSRADTNSYAKQHGLVPSNWIDIYFGGEYPGIISGEITNLEEDMIEVTTGDEEVLYINFNYKGIPEDLNIAHILVRPPPTRTKEKNADEMKDVYGEEEPENNNENRKEKRDKEREYGDEERENGDEERENREPEYDEGEDNDKDEENMEYRDEERENDEFIAPSDIRNTMYPTTIKDNLKKMYVNADNVVWGAKLTKIVQKVDVSEESTRYDIDTQLADFLDELLSTIPTNERTPQVLQDIHTLLTRYKQLREHFSTFDTNGFINGFKKHNAKYKPLKEWFHEFNKTLYWLLPVSTNVKKLYSVTLSKEEDENEQREQENDKGNNEGNDEGNDYMILNTIADVEEINTILENQDNLHADNNYYEVQRLITPFFIPYDNHAIAMQNPNEYGENTYFSKTVHTNIHNVINNLNDYESSAINATIGDNERDNVTTKRFAITNYVTERNSSMNETMLIKSFLTLPEPTIRFSKIQLPSTHLLDKANLNLHYLNYWKLLNNKTSVSTVHIDSFDHEFQFNEQDYANGFRNYVLSLNKFNHLSKDTIYNNYVNQMIPKTRVLFGLMKKYIRGKLSIVDVVSYLEPFLIYSDDLTYGQVYSNTGDTRNDNKIANFIDHAISEHNKNLLHLSSVFKQIDLSLFKDKDKRIKSKLILHHVFSLFYILQEGEQNQDLFMETIGAYNSQATDMNHIIEHHITNSEMLLTMIRTDYMRLYTTAISMKNLSLMFSHDIQPLLEKDIDKDVSASASCAKIVIAKMYNNIDQLNADNNKPIYFDKKYDKTQYGILEIPNEKGGYLEQVMNLSPDQLREFIANDLSKKKTVGDKKTHEKEADYLAETLVDGLKRVIDGQYAILYKGFSDNILDETDYYIRKNHKWVLDNSQKKSSGVSDDMSIVCNLQENCVNVENKQGALCEPDKTEKSSLQNQFITSILSEFDAKYKVSNAEFKTDMVQLFDYLRSVMPLREKIEKNHILKYNNKKYKIGLDENDHENKKALQVESPYSNALAMILKQTDLEKMYSDLLRFCHKYTRSFQPGNFTNGLVETEHWLYCVKTGARLLPTFKYELAQAFMSEVNSSQIYANPYEYAPPPSITEIVFSNNSFPNYYGGIFDDQFTLEEISFSVPSVPSFPSVSSMSYKDKLNEIISKNGSGDGDNMYIDKYTGWSICPMDFDNSDEYVDGFKVTKDILEENVDDLIQKNIEKNQENLRLQQKYASPEYRMINNVVNALSISMGVNVESSKEFIFNAVNDMMNNGNIVKSEAKYKKFMEEQAKKGKNTQSYKEYYNTYLLYFTLVLYLIAIQTTIPSIKTRKTHPGCVRSFSGYPFDPVGDDSSLQYLACVVHDIRDAGEPWNVLKRTNTEKIKERLKTICEQVILSNHNAVSIRIQDKTTHLLNQQGETELFVEHDISNWKDFMPPLMQFKVDNVTNVSPEFKEKLKNMLVSGEFTQHKMVATLESKIEKFSLSIQDMIQQIVRQNVLLLHNANNVPFIENACCNSNTKEPSILFFTNKNALISEYNNQVRLMDNYLLDIRTYSEAILFCSKINTKIEYPPISNVFDEKAIYMSFIHYCKFKSLIPIPISLLSLCKEKPPNIHPTDATDLVIKTIKDDGISYSHEEFMRLLELVGRNNLISVDTHSYKLSCIARFLSILQMEEEDDDDENDDKGNEYEEKDDKDKDKEKDGKEDKEKGKKGKYDKGKEDKGRKPQREDDWLQPFIAKTISSISTPSNKATEKSKEELFDYVSIQNDEMKETIIHFIRASSLTKQEINKSVKVIQNISEWNILERPSAMAEMNSPLYTVNQFHATYVRNFIKVFPNILMNKVTFNNIPIHKYNQFSQNHVNELKEYVSNYFSPLDRLHQTNAVMLSAIQRQGDALLQLASNTPCFITIRVGKEEISGEIQESTSRNMYEFYLLSSIMLYIRYLNQESDNKSRMHAASLNALREETTRLLYAYLMIMDNEKSKIDVTYKSIQDKIFKEKETEKNSIRNKLEKMTEDLRAIDNLFKSLKLGDYAKGTQKGLMQYDEDYYEGEADLRKMMRSGDEEIGVDADIDADEYGIHEMDYEYGENDDADDMYEQYANDD